MTFMNGGATHFGLASLAGMTAIAPAIVNHGLAIREDGH
jgi:hypothetical protein